MGENPIICALCGEIILNVRDTVWYWDKEDKKIRTKHKDDSCQKELKFKAPDFHMKRVGQVKYK